MGEPEIVQWRPAPSATSLSLLKKLMLSDLRMELDNPNSFVLVKNTSLRSELFLLEDEVGNRTNARFHFRSGQRLIDESLGTARVIAIKEPALQRDKNGHRIILICHLSDIVAGPIYDPRIRIPKRWNFPKGKFSALQWKEKGNESVKSKKYYHAIACYNKALDMAVSPELSKIIRLNRSQARLSIQCHDSAKDDADFVLNMDKVNEKALFRLARGLYAMGRFNDCYSSLEKLCSLHPRNKIAATELDRCRKRVEEVETGGYDYAAMITEASNKIKNKQPPLIDVATYQGPVEIRKCKYGSGIFTTKAVKAGTLLLCEKAFQCIFSVESPKTDVVHDETTKRPGCEVPKSNNCNPEQLKTLVTSTLNKLHRNHRTYLEAFTSLHGGSSYTPVSHPKIGTNDPQPFLLNTFQVENIIGHNNFSHRLLDSDTQFHFHENAQHGPTTTDDENSGVWLFASRFNHSCLPNVSRAFIGDIIILRASTDIPANAELFINYLSVTDPFLERSRAFENGWGFQCECRLCVIDRMVDDTGHRQRKRIKDSLLEDLRSEEQTSLFKVEIALKVLDATYPPAETREGVPRPELAFVMFYIVQALVHSDVFPEKILQFGMQLLHEMGFRFGDIEDGASGFEILEWGIVTPFVVETFWFLREVMKGVGAREEVLACLQEGLKGVYRICVGEETSFEGVYGG
ncbi:MAG: hypothetical protein Q9182_001494 [Xanthomendoza sp. 2 TL-2023]